MGQFKHVIRRNVPFVYIIENNGVYGLTKGQFSATADEGQYLKYYGQNDLPPIDLALEAIISGATFVARSFSGDSKQVQSLMQAAIHHNGIAVLDIISPCVTFNNNATSTKSYPYGKEHQISLHEIQVVSPGYVQEQAEITIDEAPEDEIIEVDMHDGTIVRLKRLGRDHDPRSRLQAMTVLEEAQREGLFLTGLIYYEEPRPTLADIEGIIDTSLATISDDLARPAQDKLDAVMAMYK